MKKIYYLMAGCLAMMALNSCSLKEDQDFDETASQRSGEHIAEVEKLLVSSPNGWLMEYYGNLNYGGYNVMVKFDGTNATFGSEKMGRNHAAGIDTEGNAVTTTSHYKVEQSMGTVISFDEFNETFHYFSMPNNPDGYGSTDEGFYGDFEFRVMKASADSIILRGKKHMNRIVMTPIPSDRTWASIIQEAEQTEEFMTSSSYTLAGADYKDTIEVSVSNNSYRCLVFTYNDSTGLKQTVAAPYIVNKDGFTFYSKVEVNGVELDGLVKGDTEDYFRFRNNSNLQLDSYLPTLAEHLETGLWCVRYGSLGAYAQPKWDNMLSKLKTAGKNKTEIKIYYAYVGVAQEKRAFHMTTSTDQPYYGFNVASKSAAGDEITLKVNTAVSASNKAGRDYYTKYGWREALEPFVGHAFRLECDNQRHPSYIRLTDKDNADNVITVYANTTYFMDDMSYYQNDN